jgi:hypothetical protein
MQESIMISVRNGPDDKLDLIYDGKRYTLRSWKLTKGGECHVQSVELDPTELKAFENARDKLEEGKQEEKKQDDLAMDQQRIREDPFGPRKKR